MKEIDSNVVRDRTSMERPSNKTYYPGSLNVAEFFEYMQNNGTKIPFKVSESRWNAMLKWFATRHKNKDWVTNEMTGNKE